MISVPFVLWGVCCLLWEGSHQTVLRRNCQALQPEWSHFSKMCNNLKLRLLDIILYGAYIWCTVLSTTLVSLNVSSQDIQKQLISLFSSSCPCCHSYPLPLFSNYVSSICNPPDTSQPQTWSPLTFLPYGPWLHKPPSFSFFFDVSKEEEEDLEETQVVWQQRVKSMLVRSNCCLCLTCLQKFLSILVKKKDLCGIQTHTSRTSWQFRPVKNFFLSEIRSLGENQYETWQLFFFSSSSRRKRLSS